MSYKRLTREIAVPASGDQTLDFWTSYDTESRVGPRVRRGEDAGGDDWTTLPDLNGHTTQATGDSCDEGWTEELHPHLEHYVTFDEHHLHERRVDRRVERGLRQLGGLAGMEDRPLGVGRRETVEVSIAYANDWATQNLGVFVDDVTLPDGTSTSFEDDLGGWEITGPPEGSGPNANNWTRTTSEGFPVGASITTPSSIFMGFGFEGISTQAERDAVMGRALEHLLE